MLPGGTAFISDVGMTGDYDSVIGMTKEEPLLRFTAADSVGAVRGRLGAGDAGGDCGGD